MLDNFYNKASKKYSISHALCRVWEYTEMVGKDFSYPMLDLGCGDGSFLKMILEGKEQEDKGVLREIYGLDISESACRGAEKSGIYKEVKCVPSHKMLFPDNRFSMAISNCVIEHIPAVEETVREAYRVLAPRGVFFFTTHSNFYMTDLFYPKIFNKLGLGFLAKAYMNSVNKIFKHYNLFTKERWEELLKSAGFEVVEIKYTHSPKHMKWYDVLMPLSALQQFFIKTIGYVPFSSSNKSMLKAIIKRTKQHEAGLNNGTNYTITAKKL